MFERIHQRLGTAGFIISIVALVAALGGGAYAASGALTGKQKKEVEKIAKKYAGKPGPAGATGPAGSAGKNGTDGTPGKDGTSGTNGKSVKLTNSSPANCNEGGFTYEVEGSAVKNEVCNGEEGIPGEGGSPWVAGGTLPPGATETGMWGANPPGREIVIGAPLSFPIPLAQRISRAHIHIQGESGFNTLCPELTSSNPGELCVFMQEVSEATFMTITSNIHLEPAPGEPEETALSGAVLNFKMTAEPFSTAYGVFAVTGCSAAIGAEFPCP